MAIHSTPNGDDDYDYHDYYDYYDYYDDYYYYDYDYDYCYYGYYSANHNKPYLVGIQNDRKQKRQLAMHLHDTRLH